MIDNIFSLKINIKHADWPHIIQLTGLYLLIIIAGYFLFDGLYLMLFTALAAVFIIILSLFHHYRALRNDLENHQYKIQAINEIMSLLKPRLPLPAMTGWAATPELAVAVLKTIITTQPKKIIELGSGVTTIVSAYAIEKYVPETVLISFDHDPVYADKTRSELKNHQLEQFVTVKNTLLTDVDINGETWRWYDINDQNLTSKIDLLIIDGPPVKTQKYARYPALPVFYEYLSDNGIVILHDTERHTETITMNRWVNELDGLEIMKNIYSEKGVTLLRKNN